jgi:protein ImuA
MAGGSLPLCNVPVLFYSHGPQSPCAMTLSLAVSRTRAQVVHELRRLLPRLEGFASQACTQPFGLPALDSHLPRGGLAFAALHEVAPATDGDGPAAFGFIAALLGRIPRGGPLLIVMPANGLRVKGLPIRRVPPFVRPHGHGLNDLGLDPSRVILVDTADEKQTLWAMEEALRSGAPAAVAGAIERLDLKTSQKLHLVAGEAGFPLVLLRPARTAEASAAATRWRVRAASAKRDDFGLIARRRWHLSLERCRNGRPGEWVVEYDHVAHRFSLASAVADPALSRGADAIGQRQAG